MAQELQISPLTFSGDSKELNRFIWSDFLKCFKVCILYCILFLSDCTKHKTQNTRMHVLSYWNKITILFTCQRWYFMKAHVFFSSLIWIYFLKFKLETVDTSFYTLKYGVFLSGCFHLFTLPAPLNSLTPPILCIPASFLA